MKKGMKMWLIIAALLVLAGGIIFVAVMSANNWDFSKLTTIKYTTNNYEITESFSDIAIDTTTADITFIKSTDGKCRVECFEDEKRAHTVKIENGTLKITENDTRAWYDYIGINLNSTTINVYLPDDFLGKLDISCTTGDVIVPSAYSFSALNIHLTTGDAYIASDTIGQLKIKCTTGDIKLDTVKCGSLIIELTTGDVNMIRTMCVGKMNITETTGNVKLDKCDASEINIKTTTGSITGSITSDKTFAASSTTGSVNVPRNTSGGLCSLKTTTGNINITVKYFPND